MEHYQCDSLKIIESSVECQAEWNLVRNKMLVARADGKRTDDFWWEFINDDACIKFPNIMKLIELFLVVVLSSVDCERFFSQMNLTKSILRTRMLTDLLNDLLMIKLNGVECNGKDSPELKKLIERAYNLWLKRKKRIPKRSRTDPRPTQQGKRKKDQTLKIERSIDDPGNPVDEEGKCTCSLFKLGGTVSDEKVFEVEEMVTFQPREKLVPSINWIIVQPDGFLHDEGLLSAKVKSVSSG